MKKVVWLTIMLILVIALVANAEQAKQTNGSASVKNAIKLEYQGQGYDFRAWFTQTREVFSVPIWWDVIVADNQTINIDAGWNPTIKFKNGSASFWFMPGVTLSTSDMSVISWKYDLFAFQKVGNWSFDQEWIYFKDTYKNWFRFFTYYKNIGLQTTGTVHRDLINFAVGPRMKIPYGGHTLEIYTGLWGVAGKDYVKLRLDDLNGKSGLFFLRYTIKFY